MAPFSAYTGNLKNICRSNQSALDNHFFFHELNISYLEAGVQG